MLSARIADRNSFQNFTPFRYFSRQHKRFAKNPAQVLVRRSSEWLERVERLWKIRETPEQDVGGVGCRRRLKIRGARHLLPDSQRLGGILSREHRLRRFLQRTRSGRFVRMF